MKSISPNGQVYLLHFDTPYRHAKHYIGFSENLDARLTEHQRGQGSRLIAVIVGCGISFQLARTWDGDRKLERKLKKRKNAPRQLCPICRANLRQHEAEVGK